MVQKAVIVEDNELPCSCILLIIAPIALLIALTACCGLGIYFLEGIGVVNKPPPPPPVKTGTLVLTHPEPIIAGAEVWAEADGHRVKNWEVGSKKLELTLQEGPRQVLVKSVYNGNDPALQKFKGQVAIRFNERVFIEADKTVTRNIPASSK
jgi:hypothetical protein